MACLNPRPAWISRNPETGSVSLSFSYHPKKKYFRAPCGKCLGCRASESLQWSIRCLHESSFYTRNSFLTLTFDEQHVTTSLQKKPLQDFFKRFRRDGSPLRYFACGEYGGLTRRPHYHALVFGHDFQEPEALSKLYSNWGNGLIDVAPLTPASVMYVCGYAQKKLEDPNDTFTVMSRKPGIGRDWLAAYSKDLENNNFVIINGAKMPIPRRYKQWFEPIKAGTAEYLLTEYKPKSDSALRARAVAAIHALREQKLKEKI